MEASEPVTVPPATLPVRAAFLGLPALGPLRHRDFRILWLGMLLSSSTIMFQWFAIGRLIENYFPRVLGEGFPILLMLGIAGLTRGAGIFVSSIAGGAFADRYDRRFLAMITQAAGIIVAGAFSLLVALGLIQIWHVIILLFAAAAAQTFDMPARQALIPQLVERGEVTNAVALFTAAFQTSFAFSPLLAGYFLDAVGIAGTYAFSMAGHGALLVALLIMRSPGRPASDGKESIFVQIREGVRYARHDPPIFGLLLISFTISAVAMSIVINLSPFWVLRVLDVSPTTWGVLGATWGIGAVTASYFWSARGSFGRKGAIFLTSSVLFCLLFIGWSLVRSPVWFGAVQYFMAIAMSTNFIAGTAIVQNLAPEAIRGRLLSLFGLNQAIALGTGIVVGAIAEAAGATTAVPIMGAVLLAAVMLYAFSLPRLRVVH
jgi:MFS family permease